MVKKVFSEKFSIAGWNALTFLKGRKSIIIAGIAAATLYVITDNELASLLAAVVFEGLVSVAEFYLNKIELE